MQTNSRQLRGTDRMVQAIDLDDAYRLGYFSNSMTRYELMARITKANPQLRWHSNKASVGLFDPNKKNAFICGIGREMTIPQWTIVRYDRTQDRVLNRCTEYGEITSKEILNMDSDKGKILMRSWRSILDVVKRKGYKVHDEDLY